jgi:hypothetical protein
MPPVRKFHGLAVKQTKSYQSALTAPQMVLAMVLENLAQSPYRVHLSNVKDAKGMPS